MDNVLQQMQFSKHLQHTHDTDERIIMTFLKQFRAMEIRGSVSMILSVSHRPFIITSHCPPIYAQTGFLSQLIELPPAASICNKPPARLQWRPRRHHKLAIGLARHNDVIIQLHRPIIQTLRHHPMTVTAGFIR